jgi:hypothetical protein
VAVGAFRRLGAIQGRLRDGRTGGAFIGHRLDTTTRVKAKLLIFWIYFAPQPVNRLRLEDASTRWHCRS